MEYHSDIPQIRKDLVCCKKMYVRIFVVERYLFLEAQSFPQAS